MVVIWKPFEKQKVEEFGLFLQGMVHRRNVCCVKAMGFENKYFSLPACRICVISHLLLLTCDILSVALILVSMRNSALRKSLISVFQELFASIEKISFWQKDWALGYHFMRFRYFPDVS